MPLAEEYISFEDEGGFDLEISKKTLQLAYEMRKVPALLLVYFVYVLAPLSQSRGCETKPF